MQELMVFAGQMDCYESCNEIISQYLDVMVSSDCIHAGEKPGWISNSQYVAHLGSHKRFTKQMEYLIDSYVHPNTEIIFITDGATWLRNWIEDAYSSSHSVLDYYHACQYLHAFSRENFKDQTKEEKWIEEQQKLLLEGKVEDVIENVRKLKSKKKEAKKLIEYFQANAERMDYKTYQKMGCGIIGSGAIESAHRKVIQKRMKQSGQRWSMEGAQNMLNLRVAKCNHKWEKVIARGCKINCCNCFLLMFLKHHFIL